MIHTDNTKQSSDDEDDECLPSGEYVKGVKAAFLTFYGLDADQIGGVEDHMYEYEESGYSPEDFARWFGDKYGLEELRYDNTEALNINTYECTGILPGLEYSIDVVYAHISDIRNAALHVKLYFTPGAFQQVGYRRLDGGTIPKQIEILEPFAKDALRQVSDVAETLRKWHEANTAAVLKTIN